MAIIAQLYAFVIGVDTHAKEHVFSIITPSGALVASKSFRTNSLAAAMRWAGKITNAVQNILWVIEGAGSYGALLAAQVTQAGYQVCEAPRMNPGIVRGTGKSDALDAHRMALAVLPLESSQLRLPRAHDGIRAALQIHLAAREQMTTIRTASVNALTALLRTHDLGVDARRALSGTSIATVARWHKATNADIGITAARTEAIRLAKQILDLDQQLAANTASLTELVTASAAQPLLEMTGVGPVTAAVAFCTWSHLGRVRNAEAFKSLAGVSPIPASSGNTVRFRLNRGGDRRLNKALYMAVICRETHDPETRAYVERRLAEGKTRKEIRRCLKTYLARRIFRTLNRAATTQPAQTNSTDQDFALQA
jgi:transposase